MLTRILIRLHSVLCRLLPGDFRRRFRAAIQADLEARVQDHPRRGRVGMVARACLDLLRQGAGLWWERISDEREGMMTGMGKEVRRAVRRLARNPGFTVSAVSTLALGLGMSAAVFAVVNAVLLRPLPYPEPDRLVSVWPEENFNVAMTRRIAAEVGAFEGVTGVSHWGMSLTGEGVAPMSFLGALVSVDHFRILGVRPLMGRDFEAGEGITGEDGVAILSHGLWVSRFGGDPDILGREIGLDGAGRASRRVVGVLPPDFLPLGGEPVEVWLPLATEAGAALGEDNTWYVNRRVARLRDGVSFEAALAEFQAAAARIHQEIPTQIEADTPRRLVPLKEEETTGSATLLWTLLGAVGLVLLIACLNVANLVAAREEGRSQERAVRRALGAGRGILVRGALVESLVLTLAGAIPAVLLAAGVVRWVASQGADTLSRGTEIAPDGGLVAGIVLAAMVAVTLTGLLPVLRSAHGTAVLVGRRVAGPGRQRGRGMLVAGELALSLVLLTGAGLLLRSMSNLVSVDPGFAVENLLTIRPLPSEESLGGAEGFRRYFREVEERIAAVPGVRSVGGIQLMPITFGNWSFPMYIDDNPVPEGTPPPAVNIRVVSPGYFETMEIPLVSGRYLESSDGEDAAPVVAVNQAFVAHYWDGEPPSGRGLRIFGRENTAREVVGVVSDVHQHSLDRSPRPEVYLTLDQYPYGTAGLHLAIRTAVPPESLLPAVREAIWAVDPNVPLVQVATMADLLSESVGRTRLVLTLLALFAGVGLVLTAVGVYGVTSYLVRRRRREFGVRIALGATEGGLVGHAWRRGVPAILTGAAAGVILSLLGGELLSGVVFGVEPDDPVVLAGVTVLLVMLATAATVVPAWRAARTDPARVLREE